ncbi:hypothetical protein GWK47_034204 [Chionoecetes opilio]|uniref:Uncharacterized protein n=1 Tax=Chionoecetes opilio TaxID=41210 RepID=A0A8J5D318_CHIOP|nr:hypothetical protein GWK47_034204 [Chionoecetes opilio]
MNATDDPTPECNPLNSHDPKYWPPSKAFTWAAIVHCYCVIVIGTLCNAVALWCVATCDKTRRPVKVLLLAIFMPAMLTCLIVYSVFAEFRVSLLTCDSNRISRKVMLITWTVFLILEQIERASIAFVAVIRAVSVWAPHRQKLGLRPTVMAMALASLYFIIIHVVVTVMLMEGKLGHSWNLSYVFSLFNTAMPMVITVVFFLNTTLPVIITAVAYSVIIVIIQRNKRRLAGSQPQEQEATTMDQATTGHAGGVHQQPGCLAFLPHSIFRLRGKYPVHNIFAVHIWFPTISW